MVLIDFFRSWVRRLQGERRGMGSELKPPTPEQEALIAERFPAVFFAPSIVIQTSVRLADVSFWQAVIDFIKMKAAGLFGVFIRAGQNTWADIKFKINWALARAARLPRGSYFFYDSRVDPGRQARLWAEQLGGDLGELPHAADFEESYGGPFGRKEHFKAFLQEFMRLTGLKPDRIIIYTGFFWWLERVGNDPWFKQFRLWIASYGSMAGVRIPAPWTIDDLLFWQYTASGDGEAYGVGSLEIDLNWYCCSPFDYLRQFPLANFELPPPPPPPTQGEPMKGTILRFTNMRAEKHQTAGDLGDLLAGDVVEFTVKEPGSDGLTWCLLTNATRNGAPVKRIDGKTVAQSPVWAWANNIEVNSTPPPPPPAEPLEEIAITQTFSSPGYKSQTVTTTLRPDG